LIRRARSDNGEDNFFPINERRFGFPRKPGLHALSGGFLETMNARGEIRDALLVRKMKRWLLIAQYPAGRACPVWQARKNCWALLRKYPALAAQHGFTATSVF